MSVTPSVQIKIADRSFTSRLITKISPADGERRPSILSSLLRINEDRRFQLSPIWLEFKDPGTEQQYAHEELVVAARQQREKSKFFHVISFLIANSIATVLVLSQIYPFYTHVATPTSIWFAVMELTVILPTYLFDTRFAATMENAAEALVDGRAVWAIALISLWIFLISTSVVDANLSILNNVNSTACQNGVFELYEDKKMSAVIFGVAVTYLCAIGMKAILSSGFRFRMKHNYLAFIVTSTSCSVWLFLKGKIHFNGDAGQIWILYLIAYGFCVFTDLVASLVPTYIYELSQRRNFILQQILKEKVQLKTDINNALTKRNSEMQKQLDAARELVASVMAEGNAVMRTFELQFESINFGEPRKMLGEGSFGTVFLGTLRGEHKVAVKTMRVSKINQDELAKFKSELIIMCPLHHPNLVKLYGGVWNEGADKLCLVLEYCPHGSLDIYLKAVRGSWESLHYDLALGAAKGLAYLHSDLKEPLMHRDIKPENILVGEGVVAKLADFGESRNFDQSAAEEAEGAPDALTMTMVGTKLFCAPEVTVGKRYNESADTFSFALVLLCLATGNIAYVKQHYGKRVQTVNYLYGGRPPIPTQVLEGIPEIARLIQDMWQGNFRLRPTMRNVVSTLNNLAPGIYNMDGGTFTNGDCAMAENALLEIQNRHKSSSKTHVAFLSYHKDACATEARLVKENYDALLEDVDCLFDSENLLDLRTSVNHVKDSDAFILFLSREVLYRPLCLIELHTAIEHDIPIVALNCQGKGYDFVEANEFMLHLEISLTTLNPGAIEILKGNNIDPARLAHKLWNVLPNIISIPLNITENNNAIKATVADIVKAVAVAKPLPIEESFEQWLKNRAKRERLELEGVLDNGTIRGTQRGRVLQKIERAVEIAEDLQRERGLALLLEATIKKQSAQIECMTAKHDKLVASLIAKNDNMMIQIKRLESKLGLDY